MTKQVYAQTTQKSQAPGPAPEPPGFKDMLLPLGLMFVVFYFLLIRPNQKKMKKRDQFLKQIKKGDSVITNGGILGRISGLTDHYVTLEISDNAKIKVLKSHIAFSEQDIKQSEKKE